MLGSLTKLRISDAGLTPDPRTLSSIDWRAQTPVGRQDYPI